MTSDNHLADVYPHTERDTEAGVVIQEPQNMLIQFFWKALPAAIKIGFQEGETFSCETERGTQEQLCSLVSTLKSQDLPQRRLPPDRTTTKTTGQWINLNPISVSYVGPC